MVEPRLLAAPASAPALKAKLQLPLLAAPANRISDREFARIFELFYTAISHELGNILNKITCADDIDTYRKSEAIAMPYRRLSSLMRISHGPDPYVTDFSKEELHTLGVGSTVRFDVVQRVGLNDVRAFRKALLEFGPGLASAKGETCVLEFEKAAQWGKLLSDALENLFMGNLCFACHMLRHQVGDPSVQPSNHSLFMRRLIWEGANRSGCKVTFNPEDAGGIAVLADPLFVALISGNLAANAKRAMGLAKVEKPAIMVSVSRKGEDTVAFRFTDKGCGMAKEIMDKLNSGERVSTKTEEGEHGIGFGYCRELAEKMGGKLYVESSEVGKGTTIVLELKAA
jgi:signal transduction histidine kinase